MMSAIRLWQLCNGRICLPPSVSPAQTSRLRRTLPTATQPTTLPQPVRGHARSLHSSKGRSLYARKQRTRACWSCGNSRRARTLLRNLRVSGNGPLRARLAQGEVAAADVVSAAPEELMDPAAAERWRATKKRLFAQHSVVDTEEALSNKVVVDTARCPQCKNTSLNLRLQIAAHLESSKAETWGSKDARSDDKVRFKCSKCNFSWSREGG